MIKNFKSWIKCAGMRAIKTFAQTFVATIGTGAAVLGDVNWIMVFSSAALAAIMSLAMSIAGLPEVKTQVELEVVETEEPEKVEEVVEENNEHKKEK